jgi:dTMP kinase
MTRFIAIEGIDGTGKTTQFDLLTKHIRDNLKKPVLELDFPRYGKPSARYVGRYLNGEYGRDIAPDLAAMLYAFDRWQAKPEIDAFVTANPDGYIISNRYVASNLAHQGGKIAEQAARHQFYDEQMDLEFNQFGIMRPDLSFVLLLPEKTAQENVDKKAARAYTAKKRDLHEDDDKHLQNAASAYHELVELYPREFVAIDCWDAGKGKMKSVEEIQKMIERKLRALLD